MGLQWENGVASFSICIRHSTLKDEHGDAPLFVEGSDLIDHLPCSRSTKITNQADLKTEVCEIRGCN
jgi:hypothetical protein